MDLQQLRYVVAVAEEKNFTRAAHRSFVVQSALSHQIKALEREIGVTLFARTSRRVELTAAGEAFVAQARISLAAVQRAVDEAAAAAGIVRGELRVGMIPTVTAVDVPGILAGFRRSHPDVRISVRVGGSDDIEASIAEGGLDIGLLGFTETREPQRVAWRLLRRDRLVAVVGTGHRLAVRSRLRISDLADETFADFPAGTPGRAQSDIAFAAAGVHRDVAFEAMAIDMLMDLVRENLAVILLPSLFAPRDPQLRRIPLESAPQRHEYLAWSAFHPRPAARAFISLLDGETPQSRGSSSNASMTISRTT